MNTKTKNVRTMTLDAQEERALSSAREVLRTIVSESKDDRLVDDATKALQSLVLLDERNRRPIP